MINQRYEIIAIRVAPNNAAYGYPSVQPGTNGILLSGAASGRYRLLVGSLFNTDPPAPPAPPSGPITQVVSAHKDFFGGMQ